MIARSCFVVPQRIAPVALRHGAGLGDDSAEALAELMPLLGCGEEAASLAFEGLAQRASATEATALRSIAAEELEHEALFAGLSASLPQPQQAEQLRRAARRFHISLGVGGPRHHLARIAALDSGVCLIFGRLVHAAPITAAPQVRAMFDRVRRDESRHVMIARRLVAAGEQWDPRPLGEAARVGLSATLGLGAAFFERLEIDPDRLLRDLAHLPSNLYTVR